MKDIWGDFLLMLQFFTRIPIRKSLPCQAINFRRGVFFMPLIGFIVGSAQYLVGYLLKETLPTSVLAAILVIIPLIITGGFHIDGLGDTADGFFSFKGDKARILEIMKDSNAGTYSICAIVTDILLQYATIEHILKLNKIQVLLVITMFSKIFVLFTAMWGKPAKEGGSGNIFIGNISIHILLMSILYSLIIGLMVIPVSVNLTLLFSGAVVSLLFYYFCNSKINGITGDTLGATQEIVIMVMLIVYCAIV